MAYEIAGITTCKLCGRKFAGPLALVIGQGQQPHGRLIQHLNQLAQHFAETHPNENGALQLKSLEYLGMLRLLNFITTDEELRRQLDFLRWTIHQSTLLHRVPDDKMKAQAEELAKELVSILYSVLPENQGAGADYYWTKLRPRLEAQYTEKILAKLTIVRDILEEPGRFQVSPIEAAATTENLIKQ